MLERAIKEKRVGFFTSFCVRVYLPDATNVSTTRHSISRNSCERYRASVTRGSFRNVARYVSSRSSERAFDDGIYIGFGFSSGERESIDLNPSDPRENVKG